MTEHTTLDGIRETNRKTTTRFLDYSFYSPGQPRTPKAMIIVPFPVLCLPFNGPAYAGLFSFLLWLPCYGTRKSAKQGMLSTIVRVICDYSLIADECRHQQACGNTQA